MSQSERRRMESKRVADIFCLRLYTERVDGGINNFQFRRVREPSDCWEEESESRECRPDKVEGQSEQVRNFDQAKKNKKKKKKKKRRTDDSGRTDFLGNTKPFFLSSKLSRNRIYRHGDNNYKDK